MKLKSKIRWLLSSKVDWSHQSPTAKEVSYQLLKLICKESAVTSVRSALSRLVQSGQVERIESPAGRFFRLTQLGVEEFKAEFRMIDNLLNRSSATSWLISFFFPERQRMNRDRLRLMLTLEGWLRLNRSLYLSYRPPSRYLKEQLKHRRWRGHVILWEVKSVDDDKAAEFIRRSFNFETIYAAYLSFISQADGVIGLASVQKRREHWLNMLVEAINKFFDTLDLDPGLTGPIWAPENLFIKAWQRFIRLTLILEKQLD